MFPSSAHTHYITKVLRKKIRTKKCSFLVTTFTRKQCEDFLHYVFLLHHWFRCRFAKYFTNFSMPLSLQPLFFKLSLKFLLVVPNQNLCNGPEMEWIKTEWVEGEHIFRNFNSLPSSWHFVRIAKIFSLTFYLTSAFDKANHNSKFLLHSGLNFVSIMCKCIHLYPNCKWPRLVWASSHKNNKENSGICNRFSLQSCPTLVI